MKLTKEKLQHIIEEELNNLTLLGEIDQSSHRITSYDLLKHGNNSQNAFGYLMTLDDDRLSDALDIINSEPQVHTAYTAGIQYAKEAIQKIESKNPLGETYRHPSPTASSEEEESLYARLAKPKAGRFVKTIPKEDDEESQDEMIPKKTKVVPVRKSHK